jgi:hypothetical protein
MLQNLKHLSIDDFKTIILIIEMRRSETYLRSNYSNLRRASILRIEGTKRVKVGGKQFALRVSTLPVTEGEKVVMRILDESNQAVPLESLGFWGQAEN